MFNIAVYGCGGFSLEVLGYLRDLFLANTEKHSASRVIGVIDLDGSRIADAQLVWGYKLRHFWSLSEIDKANINAVIIAIGDPEVRHRLARETADAGFELYTVVHPTAYIASTAQLGNGAIVAPFGFVGPNAILGRNSVLNTYASAGHDCIIEDSAVLSPYAALNGNSRLGAASFLGSKAVILPGVNIGQNCKVSAGSCVFRDVKDNSMVAGNPAKSRVMFAPIE